MSHKSNVYSIVRQAALDVWLKQLDGTRLPHIIVKLDLRAPHIKLIAVEAGKPELIKSEDIAIFAGGKPMWRTVAKQLRDKFPGDYEGLSLAAAYDRHLKRCNENDFGHILTEIQIALKHKGQAWLRDHGLDPGYGPGAMLSDYLRRSEVLPAAMLAHVILYQWSHDPITYWYSFFELCDRLMTYCPQKKGANPAPHNQQFAQIISLCLGNFSKNLNRQTAKRFATKRPLPKLYYEIHSMILQRLRTSWCGVTTTHAPHPRITAQWL